MLILQNISYAHPNQDILFAGVNLAVNPHDKIAIIGNNGAGKSTLLKLIAGTLKPVGGQLKLSAQPFYLPQNFGQYDALTVAEALRVQDKLNALDAILKGKATAEDYTVLNDDWTIEERCQDALAAWDLTDLPLGRKMETLSGGQKTKVFLAGMSIHDPELVLLDEPSNHLDVCSRALLYDFVTSTKRTLMVVSHDRTLLNRLNTVCELSYDGIRTYGGNYEFYRKQKAIERQALDQDIHSKEKALRKAKQKERESLERQQKLDARGKKKQVQAGASRMMINTLRNHAEKSSAKLKGTHHEKVGSISKDLSNLRSSLPEIDKMKFGFAHATLHQGKNLFTATNMNMAYGHHALWKANLSFQIRSGERLVLRGKNGSGKTTLIKLLLGQLEPTTGTMVRAENKSIYIDQDYSLIDDALNVFEQAQQFNQSALQEHEIKIRLNRFLFTQEDWHKSCRALSGGERMRLALCCLMINQEAPDMIVLDEPTNNLDIQNIEILTQAIRAYQGTLMVVSHDETFLEQVKIEREIGL